MDFYHDAPDFLENADAPCAETFPDMFFSDEKPFGTMAHRPTYEFENEAKKVCAECPYRLACLKYAMEHPEILGIWGGLTEKDRKAVRRGTRGINITYRNKSR